VWSKNLVNNEALATWWDVAGGDSGPNGYQAFPTSTYSRLPNECNFYLCVSFPKNETQSHFIGFIAHIYVPIHPLQILGTDTMT
jgi:hypothetical protein